MAVIGEAIIEVKPDSKNFGSETEKSVLSSLGPTLAKVGTAVAAATTVRSGFDFLKDATLDAQALNSQMAITKNVIETTGGAAGKSFEDLAAVAKDLEMKVGVDDTEILNAQNILLTFTKVSGDQFDEATALAYDMAAVLGTDAVAGATQLGKALNDPIVGVGALAEAGVGFNEQQKEQIKTMQEAGDIAGAQNVVLAELQLQFGGAAEASADSTDKIAVAMGNLKQAAGSGIIGAIDGITPALTDAIGALEPLFASIGEVVGGALEGILPILTDVVAPLGTLFAESFGGVLEAIGPVLSIIGETIGGTLGTIGPVIAETVGVLAESFGGVIANLAPVIGIIGETIGALAPVIGQVIGDIGFLFSEFIGPLLADIAPVITEVVGVFSESFGTVLSSLGGVVEELGPILGDLAAVFGEVFGGLAETIGPVIGTIAEVISGLLDAIGPVLVTIGGVLLDTFATVGDAIVPVIGTIAGVIADLLPTIVPVVASLAEAFGQLIEAVGPALGEIAGKLLDAFVPILPVLGDVITSLVEGLAPVIPVLVDAFLPLLPVVVDLAGILIDALAPILPLLGDALKSLAPVIGTVAKALAGGLGAAFEAIVPVLATIIDALAPVVEILIEAFAPIIPVIVDLVSELVDALGGAFGDVLIALLPLVELLAEVLVALSPVIELLATLLAGVLTVAVEVISTALEAVVGIITELIDFVVGVFQGDWSEAWDKVASVFSAAFGVVQAVAGGVWDFIKSVFTTGAGIISAVWSGLWDGITAVVTGAWDLIKSVVTGAWDLIVGAFNLYIDTVRAVWSGLWDGLVAVVTFAWDLVTGAATAAWDNLVATFNSIKDFITGIWNGLWGGLDLIVHTVVDGVVDFVTGLPGRISDAVSGMWDSLKDGFADVVNSIIEIWNKLDIGIGPFSIPDWVPVVGGNSFEIKDVFPDIPKVALAEGSVINRATFAMIGEDGPEVVVPLSKTDRMIELLLQALNQTGQLDRLPDMIAGLGGARAFQFPGYIPKLAQGAIVGSSAPITSAPKMAGDDLLRLLMAMLGQSGASLDTAPLTVDGLAPDFDTFSRIRELVRARGAMISESIDGDLVVALDRGFRADTAAAGRPVLTSAADILGNVDGDLFTINVIQPDGGPSPFIAARTEAQAREALTATVPYIAEGFDGDSLTAKAFPVGTPQAAAYRGGPGNPNNDFSLLVNQMITDAQERAAASDQTTVVSGGPVGHATPLGFYPDGRLAMTAPDPSGDEQHAGVWFNRGTGQIIGFSEGSDNSEPRLASRSGGGGGLLDPSHYTSSVQTVPENVRAQWRLDEDNSAAIVRTTLEAFQQVEGRTPYLPATATEDERNIAAAVMGKAVADSTVEAIAATTTAVASNVLSRTRVTDFGLSPANDDDWSAIAEAASNLSWNVTRFVTADGQKVNEDGSGSVLTDSGMVVRFHGIGPDFSATAPVEQDFQNGVEELRRTWDYLSSTIGGAFSQDAIRIQSETTAAEFLAQLPYYPQMAVKASSLLPSTYSSAGAVDVVEYLRRLGFEVVGDVPQLASGGIISPRTGGTLVNVAEAGRAEAVVPLPDGFLGQLGSTPASQTAAPGIAVSIDKVELPNVRDAENVPAAFFRELDLIIYQNG